MENVPDREYFVMGSNAGANSSTFDLYRHSKSREMKRLRAMEEEALAEERNAAFKKSMEVKNAEEESKTAARRAKRLKQKVSLHADISLFWWGLRVYAMLCAGKKEAKEKGESRSGESNHDGHAAWTCRDYTCK